MSNQLNSRDFCPCCGSGPGQECDNICKDIQRNDPNTDDYRNAPLGEGPLAFKWKDKPHRLVYDLASAVDILRDRVAELDATITVAKGHAHEITELESAIVALFGGRASTEEFDKAIETVKQVKRRYERALRIQAERLLGNSACPFCRTFNCPGPHKPDGCEIAI